jgi:hypothetical protein
VGSMTPHVSLASSHAKHSVNAMLARHSAASNRLVHEQTSFYF